MPFEGKFVQKFLKFTKIYVKISLAFAYVSSVGVIILGFYEMSLAETREFIIKSDINFDIKFTPLYQIINIIQLIVIMLIPCIHVSTDLIYLSLGFILIEYLKMLQKSFKSAIKLESFEKISKLIEVHRKIIKFHKNFNGFYMPMTFTSYVLNVIMACFFSYQIMEVK